jgi:hypothetical protein
LAKAGIVKSTGSLISGSVYKFGVFSAIQAVVPATVAFNSNFSKDKLRGYENTEAAKKAGKAFLMQYSISMLVGATLAPHIGEFIGNTIRDLVGVGVDLGSSVLNSLVKLSEAQIEVVSTLASAFMTGEMVEVPAQFKFLEEAVNTVVALIKATVENSGPTGRNAVGPETEGGDGLLTKARKAIWENLPTFGSNEFSKEIIDSKIQEIQGNVNKLKSIPPEDIPKWGKKIESVLSNGGTPLRLDFFTPQQLAKMTTEQINILQNRPFFLDRLHQFSEANLSRTILTPINISGLMVELRTNRLMDDALLSAEAITTQDSTTGNTTSYPGTAMLTTLMDNAGVPTSQRQVLLDTARISFNQETGGYTRLAPQPVAAGRPQAPTSPIGNQPPAQSPMAPPPLRTQEVPLSSEAGAPGANQPPAPAAPPQITVRSIFSESEVLDKIRNRAAPKISDQGHYFPGGAMANQPIESLKAIGVANDALTDFRKPIGLDFDARTGLITNSAPRNTDLWKAIEKVRLAQEQIAKDKAIVTRTTTILKPEIARNHAETLAKALGELERLMNTQFRPPSGPQATPPVVPGPQSEGGPGPIRPVVESVMTGRLTSNAFGDTPSKFNPGVVEYSGTGNNRTLNISGDINNSQSVWLAKIASNPVDLKWFRNLSGPDKGLLLERIDRMMKVKMINELESGRRNYLNGLKDILGVPRNVSADAWDTRIMSSGKKPINISQLDGYMKQAGIVDLKKVLPVRR